MSDFDLILYNPSKKYSTPVDTIARRKRKTYTKWIHTPLGCMRACSYQSHLTSLYFADGLPDTSSHKASQAFFSTCESPPQESCQLLEDLKNELDAYFKGDLFQFTIPFEVLLSSFEEKTFTALTKIPYGEMINYTKQTEMMGVSSNHTRAAANANGRNPILVLMPCHRVIRKDKSYGGFNAGIERKIWLLEHEHVMRHKHSQAYTRYINAFKQ